MNILIFSDDPNDEEKQIFLCNHFIQNKDVAVKFTTKLHDVESYKYDVVLIDYGALHVKGDTDIKHHNVFFGYDSLHLAKLWGDF